MSTPRMNTNHWFALSAVYLERARRALVAGTFLGGPVAVFFAHRSGYRADEVALNLLVVALTWPMAAAGVVGKCKADGSLSFLASLPVSRHDHARAWLSVIMLLALPATIAAVVVTGMHAVDWSAAQLLMIGAGAMAVITAFVATVVAVQLSVPPVTAVVYFANGMGGLVLLVGGIGELVSWQQSALVAVLQHPLFLPVLSLMAWGSAGLVLWWSWHRIGHYMTSYVGDAPRA